MLDKFLSAVFDEQYEFNDIWELKLIKFDADLGDNLKLYEKHLGISQMVEDIKGNPGLKGLFSLSNLRIIWYAQNDKLDTIKNVTLKQVPIAGSSEIKYIITLKAVSPNQIKYQFCFSGATEKEERIFKMVIDFHKKFTETKAFRNIDTSIKSTSSQFKPMQEEDIKTTYHKCVFEENQIKRDAVIILTNIRMIIFHEKNTESSSDRNTGINYSIPWIMIEGFSKVDRNGRDWLEVKIRGLLKNAQIFITCSHRQQFSKIHKEIVSFCQSYNKNPCLGINFTKLGSTDSKISTKAYRDTEVTEIENTKVNIGRRKNTYGGKNQKDLFKIHSSMKSQDQ